MSSYRIEKEIPVRYSADVVVCGGGVAGVYAAVAAAREGKSAIIVEQFGSLGGSATNALVTPLMSSHIPGNPQCSSINIRFNEILKSMNGCNEYCNIFDPMTMRFAYEALCAEYGVKLVYYTFITGTVSEDRKIKGITCASKSGEFVVEGKEFIDCTGDGDVCVSAGCGYMKGNPDTGKCQPISLRYTVADVDIDAFGKCLLEQAEKTGVKRGGDYADGHVYGAVTLNGEWTFSALFDEAIKAGDLVPEDKMYWQVFQLPNKPNTLAFNNPEFFENVDGTDTDHLTQTQIEGKIRIMRHMNFYKKYLKGFEHAYISEVAEMVGVRESRNIITEYVLTAEDILGKRKFPDAFAQTNYPIDVHGKELNLKHVDAVDDKPWYDIPYGTIVAKEYDNLFVAGRCVGADFVAQSSLRIQPTCRSSGEAAGIAASLCIDENKCARDIDGKKVRSIMEAAGADYAK